MRAFLDSLFKCLKRRLQRKRATPLRGSLARGRQGTSRELLGTSREAGRPSEHDLDLETLPKAVPKSMKLPTNPSNIASQNHIYNRTENRCLKRFVLTRLGDVWDLLGSALASQKLAKINQNSIQNRSQNEVQHSSILGCVLGGLRSAKIMENAERAPLKKACC